MVRNPEETSIPLMKSTRERLKTYGQKGVKWDTLLNDLMDEVDTLNAAASDLSRELQHGGYNQGE